ncbi:MAG: transporter, partial [Sandarakinorhabdus sp.]|nr:transporter [Sandarakinorhabdus sp.]
PVIPISLNADWNLISRTIVPLVWQNNIAPGSGSQFGLGDTVQRLFFSPAQPRGVIWSVGPALLLPTGTNDLLSARTWGAGTTGVVSKQIGPWTVGALANHIWSFAGDSARNDISATFVNPFINHASKTGMTVGVQADVTYGWKNDNWTVPVSASLSQVTKIGGQLVSIGGALRYYVASNDAAPHGFAGRFSVTLLFPN